MRRPHSVAVMMSFGLIGRLVMIRRPWGHWSGVVVRRRVPRIMMVRIIVSLCYNASATTSALCLQCLWGEVSSVYALYARRAAPLFAARDSDRCGRASDEFLSAASSRTSNAMGLINSFAFARGRRPAPLGLVASFLGPATSSLCKQRLRFARGLCSGLQNAKFTQGRTKHRLTLAWHAQKLCIGAYSSPA